MVSATLVSLFLSWFPWVPVVKLIQYLLWALKFSLVSIVPLIIPINIMPLDFILQLSSVPSWVKYVIHFSVLFLILCDDGSWWGHMLTWKRILRARAEEFRTEYIVCPHGGRQFQSVWGLNFLNNPVWSQLWWSYLDHRVVGGVMVRWGLVSALWLSDSLYVVCRSCTFFLLQFRILVYSYSYDPLYAWFWHNSKLTQSLVTSRRR